jgi:uncharacterized protein YjbJ (UPF0337 family)
MPGKSFSRGISARCDRWLVAIHSTLSEENQALLRRVRAFLEGEVAPIITEYWIREEFPHQLLPKLAELNIMGLPYQGYDCPGKSMVLDGMLMMELARVDSSFATFRGVHSGLAMGSIYLCGSEEQKQRWLLPMARLEKIGSFGLTEPLVGSGASGAGNTSCFMLLPTLFFTHCTYADDAGTYNRPSFEGREKHRPASHMYIHEANERTTNVKDSIFQDRIQGNWKELRGTVRREWGKLTHDDVEQVKGNAEVLAGLIQERYGVAKAEARKQIEAWAARLMAHRPEQKQNQAEPPQASEN